MQDYRKHYQLFVSNSVIFQRALNIMNDNLKSTNRCSFQLNAEDIKRNGATSTRRKVLIPQADLT
jgi:hypothetical protein